MVQECVEAGKNLGRSWRLHRVWWSGRFGVCPRGDTNWIWRLLLQCQLKGVRAASRLVDLTRMVISCGFMHSGGNSYVKF